MQRFFKKRHLVVRLLIISATLAMSGTAYCSYRAIHDFALESLKKNAFLETKRGVEDLDRWLGSLKYHIEILANTETVRSMDWTQAEPYLKTEISRFKGMQTIAIAQPNGWRNAVNAKPVNISDRLYFQRAMTGQTNVSDPLISRSMNVPGFIVATAIRDSENGSPIGEIHSLTKLDRISEVIQSIQFGDKSYAFILSSEGKAIAHPQQDWISTIEKPAPSLLTLGDRPLGRIAQQMVSKREGFELVEIDGTLKYVAYLPLKEADWSVALVIPRETVESPLRSLDLLASVIAGLSFLMMGLLWQIQWREKQQLQRSAEELERRVLERTTDLSVALENLQRSQGQLIQSEKMSALGQLVAGIAHEINNPVNFIHGNLEYVNTYGKDLVHLIHLYQKHHHPIHAEIQQVQTDLDLDFMIQDMPKIFSSMKSGADRIKEIVLSLRSFSRMDESEVKTVDLHDGLNSTLVILGHRLNGKFDRTPIQVTRDYGELPLVECYAGQINQVFMNILSNAIDALHEARISQPNHEGEIRIQTSIVNDHWIKIEIIDNALGMGEAVRSQIFNPFFTTKPIGKGTGMGMAISYQIITEKQGGTLDCHSTLGQGTQLVIQLPIVLPKIASDRPSAQVH
jgi:two-component system, NtrC family, sensor kinase